MSLCGQHTRVNFVIWQLSPGSVGQTLTLVFLNLLIPLLVASALVLCLYSHNDFFLVQAKWKLELPWSEYYCAVGQYIHTPTFLAAIVQVLLDHDPGLSKTIGPSNATPLISAAQRGHIAVVDELLSKDCTLLEISKSNGKNALHLAARGGHVEIVRALLSKDPQLARRTDKKGQTALHMAVKGTNCEVVKLLLEADPAIVMLPDKFGNTALHVATRKKRAEVLYIWVTLHLHLNWCIFWMVYGCEFQFL